MLFLLPNLRRFFFNGRNTEDLQIKPYMVADMMVPSELTDHEHGNSSLHSSFVFRWNQVNPQLPISGSWTPSKSRELEDQN